MKGSRRLLSIILASGIVTLAARALAAGSHAVVINEIHYHPGEGSGFEFVEIHNFSAAPIDVGRWSFRKGLHAEIPPGRILPAGGFLVACASPADLALRYGLPEAALVPWVESRLANEGEEILLVDATGAAVDAVRYDDRTPWPTAPDGSGPSLQRLCPRADSNGPTNWVGASGQDPTPLAPNVILECPPPVYPPPRVALNEIHYHPFNDRDADEEYLEITNAAAETIDLQGYCFIDGIDFCFTGPTPLEPGAFIVVCRNQAFIRSTYGITNAAGDFLGELLRTTATGPSPPMGSATASRRSCPPR